MAEKNLKAGLDASHVEDNQPIASRAPVGVYVEGLENAGRGGTTSKKSGAVNIVENPLKVCLTIVSSFLDSEVLIAIVNSVSA